MKQKLLRLFSANSFWLIFNFKLEQQNATVGMIVDTYTLSPRSLSIGTTSSVDLFFFFLAFFSGRSELSPLKFKQKLLRLFSAYSFWLIFNFKQEQQNATVGIIINTYTLSPLSLSTTSFVDLFLFSLAVLTFFFSCLDLAKSEFSSL
jgi:hypothetical protein